MTVPAGYPIRVPKTSDLLARHLRSRIVRGELREGEALPSESILCDEFAVSRPTIREAFRVLESEGLLSVHRGAQGGARVHAPSVQMAAKYAGLVLQSAGTTLNEVLEARTFIEPPLAGLLAQATVPARTASARTLRMYVERNTPPPGDFDYAAEFHAFSRLLISLTGNAAVILVTSMLEAIVEIAAPRLRKSERTAEHFAVLHDRAINSRVALANLIESGDVDGAARLWRAHLLEVSREIAGEEGDRVVEMLDR